MQANATTLKFPSERHVDKRDRVSYEAMDLINSILQEKEHRLCSQKYKFNDFQHSKSIPGRLLALRANKQSRDYQGHYVYPNDATDIKAHPFFRGIIWERLHLSRPPFIPDIKNNDDTKYFDDEDGPISDVDDASSYCSVQERMNELFRPKANDTVRITQVDDTEGPLGPAHGSSLPRRDISAAIVRSGDGRPRMKKPREKRRPRDRVLRDKDVGRKVLELRKKGAFLGYTYHRPSLGVGSSEESSRGRHISRS